MARTLWNLRAGESCEILGYDDALAESYRVRLTEFGFYPGGRVTCVQTPALGAPRVYRISNTIYSLDDQVAAHVFIRAPSDA